MTDLPQRPESFNFALDFLGGSDAAELLAYVEALEGRWQRVRPRTTPRRPVDAMTTNPYRAMCAELLCAMDEIAEYEVVDWAWVKTQPLKMASQSMAEARALLDQPEPQPVPVSEGLPGPGDCDAEGRCWYGAPDRPGAVACWDLEYEPATDDTHWLPAHALPVPTHTSENV